MIAIELLNIAKHVYLYTLFCNIFSYDLTPTYLNCLLCNSTYASKYIPIIASVSEHQPPTWPSYFMDINVLAFLVPAGIIVSFCLLRKESFISFAYSTL